MVRLPHLGGTSLSICEGDIGGSFHLLRSFYAIRNLMGTYLKEEEYPFLV